MAGPFGRTSDTTTAVSPFSGLGLSLPPDMAKPKPSLGSCDWKKKNKKMNETKKEAEEKNNAEEWAGDARGR